MKIRQGQLAGRYFFRIDSGDRTLFVSRVHRISNREKRHLTLAFLTR